jgi:hypothetical protein
MIVPSWMRIPCYITSQRFTADNKMLIPDIRLMRWPWFHSFLINLETFSTTRYRNLKSHSVLGKHRNNVSILFVSVLSRKCGLFSVNAKHRKSIRETENSGVSHFNRDCCIYNTCMLALYLQSVSSNVQLKESQRGFPLTNVIWLMKVEQVYRSNRHLYWFSCVMLHRSPGTIQSYLSPP